jgi:hypothetical protein
MSLGGGAEWEGGGLKVSLPPYEIFVKGYPFWKKMAFYKKILTFLAKK